MTPEIANKFQMIKVAADSAGDTISLREAVDCIHSVLVDVKPLIVALELQEESEKAERYKGKVTPLHKPIPYRLGKKRL